MFKYFKRIIFTLILFGLGLAHFSDRPTVIKANAVLNKIQLFCNTYSKYPNKVEFHGILKSNSIVSNDWYLFTSKDLTNATLQYPMNFWHIGAPGKAKLSEFLPVVYSYTVTNPCKQ